MKKVYQLLICMLLIYGATSCKDQELAAPDPVGASLTATSTSNVASYPLDWENLDYMPVAPGQPQPLAPWKTGASTGISFDMLYDYKKADGWELLYNIFNSQHVETNGYFILYNKYRGIIRLYYYTGNHVKDSKHIVHALSLAGSGTSNSQLLDFAEQEVVDYTTRSREASTVEKELYRKDTWYAFEYELAYDPAIPSNSQGSYSMIWDMKGLNIQDFKANGSGTITGNIPSFSAPGINLALSPSYTNKSNSGIQITSTEQVNNTPTGSASWLTVALKAGLSKAVTNGVAGIATNILSGIFTKKKDNSGNSMTLKLKSTTSLSGTIDSNFGLPRLTMPVPGYGAYQYANTYNKVPGVFYISKRPTVTEAITYYAQYNANREEIPGWYQTDYKDVRDFNLVFNPEVLAIANITNIKYEVVVNGTEPKIAGTEEYIGTNRYYTGTSASIKARGMGDGTLVGVRVSFKVVPKDGSPAVLIVKTFKANITTTSTTVYPPPGGGGGYEDS